MATGPETRPSLVRRLIDPADDAAWEEFVAIYRPVIVWLALRAAKIATSRGSFQVAQAERSI